MISLTNEDIESWKLIIPDDVKVIFDSDESTNQDAIDYVNKELPRNGDLEETLSWIMNNQENLTQIGRARRIRILSWILNQNKEQKIELVNFLVEQNFTGENEEESGSSEGGISKIAPVFLQDIKSYAEALSTRKFKAIAHAEAINAITAGAREVISQIDMKHGG